jgi:two-component system chemotaxis response regulator CheY
MRILVVDDDYVSRTKLKALLAVHGDVDAASSGDLAIRMFQAAHGENVPYDLVTMDVNMPDMRGQEVVAAMREYEKNEAADSSAGGAKILMITAVKGGKDVMSAFREGCEWYLVKPVTPENLAEAMGKLEISHKQRVDMAETETTAVVSNISLPDLAQIDLGGLESEFWNDYLSSTIVNLEKLEAAAMEMEDGDESQLDPIKRLLHSIKGESGMIGLNAVQQVVHDAESACEEMGPTPAAADMVLTVKDWVETVVRDITRRVGQSEEAV